MATASATVGPKGDLTTKILYGLGSVAFGVKDNGFNVLLMLYYNQVLGLPAQTVGTAIMIALFADAFIDPLVGHASDNWRSRWGRRHPFMYAAALPASLSYLVLWNPPAGLSQAQLFYYLLVTSIVIRSFISCYEVPSAALAPELSHDYDQRTSLLSFRFFFGWCGALSMAIVTFRVFLVPDADYPIGQLNPRGYSAYGVAAATVMFAAILISTAGTHRHIPKLTSAPPSQPFSLMRILREARTTLSNKAFLTALGNCTFGAMALGVGAGMVMYMSTYFWELSALQIAVLMLGNILSAFGALASATAIAKRFEKKKALLVTSATSMTLGSLPLALRLLGWFPANHSPSLMPLLFVITTTSTMFIIICSILSASMMADVVEDSQTKTGRRSEGLFFSASAFVLKCVSGVGVGATGLILSLAHFPESAKPGEVAREVLVRMASMQMALTLTFSLVAIAFAFAYPISRAAHEANLRKLGAHRRPCSDPVEVLAIADRAGLRSSLRPTL